MQQRVCIGAHPLQRVPQGKEVHLFQSQRLRQWRQVLVQRPPWLHATSLAHSSRQLGRATNRRCQRASWCPGGSGRAASRGSEVLAVPRRREGDLSVDPCKDGGGLGGHGVLVPQLEEVADVLGLEEALLPRIPQHLLTAYLTLPYH